MPKMGRRNTVYIEEPYVGIRMASEQSKNLLYVGGNMLQTHS